MLNFALWFKPWLATASRTNEYVASFAFRTDSSAYEFGSVYFASRKLSQAECNYTTTEREALAIIYALQKFRHYLLGGHFKFFTDHSALKYLVNKLVLEGRPNL